MSKALPFRKYLVPAVLVGLLVLLALAGWNALDLGTRVTVSRAIDDLMERNRVDEARKALFDLNDRRVVLEAVTDALDDDEDNVPGKIELLRTLDILRDTGAMRRALDSGSLSTRRAAAAYFSDDAELRSRVAPIALEWLKDEQASGRRYAAQLCSRLELAEAVPVLESMLARPARTAEEEELATAALQALVGLDAEGIGETAYGMAADRDNPEQVRSAAFYALGRAKDLPVDKVRTLALGILVDRNASNLVRSTATGVLQRRDVADEAVWDAFEKVLVDRNEPEPALQRMCLNALGVNAPFDRLERVLLRAEVYGHAYFGIRTDVAKALAVMNLRNPLAYDVLLGYLVDEDPQDTKHLVRGEGWISLWSLTGMMYGVSEEEIGLFRKEPATLTDPIRIRQNLWSGQWLRHNVTESMWNAVAKVTGDLDAMKRIRETYTNAKGTFLDAWREQTAGAGAEVPPDDPNSGG